MFTPPKKKITRVLSTIALQKIIKKTWTRIIDVIASDYKAFW